MTRLLRSPSAAATLVAVLLSLAAGVVGFRQGLPNLWSYHQDAVAPLRALGFLERYTDPPAVVDKYPVGAYLLYGVAARAALAWRGDDSARALLALARERGPDAWTMQSDPNLWRELAPHRDAISDCIAFGRLACALMNALLALFGALLAGELCSASARPWAALLLGLHPYDVYYAHTMNVDAPCLAFALAAAWLLARGLRTACAATFAACGVAAAAAAATKDQIVAWLAFAPLALALLWWRQIRRGAPRPPIARLLAAGALGFAAAYAVFANLIFAPGNWLAHARFGLSPEIREQYRMAPFTPAGLCTLLSNTFHYFVRSAGIAGAVLMVVGAAYGLLRRRAALLLLLLPAAGYYVVFVLRQGLTYPRHLLPVFVPLLVLSAGAIAATLRPAGRRRVDGALLAGLALAVAWRGATVDRLWSSDPRERAAAWLAENLKPTDRVLCVTNHATPPPRIPDRVVARWSWAADLATAFRELDPTVVVRVVSTELFRVAGPVHPVLEPPGTNLGGVAVWQAFGRETWHPILDDIDAAPAVLILRR